MSSSKSKPTEHEIAFAKKLLPDHLKEAARLLAEQREWRAEVAKLPTADVNSDGENSQSCAPDLAEAPGHPITPMEQQTGLLGLPSAPYFVTSHQISG